MIFENVLVFCFLKCVSMDNCKDHREWRKLKGTWNRGEMPWLKPHRGEVRGALVMCIWPSHATRLTRELNSLDLHCLICKMGTKCQPLIHKVQVYVYKIRTKQCSCPISKSYCFWKTLGPGSQWVACGAHSDQQIKFDWHAAVLICIPTVCGCFPATVTELVIATETVWFAQTYIFPLCPFT